MIRDISPEEKLLKLIKRRPKSKAPEKVNPTAGPGPQTKPVTNEDSVANSKKSVISTNVLPQLKNIFLINRVLLIMFILVILYFIYDYFFVPSVKIEQVLAEKIAAEEILKIEPVRQPYSYYEKEIAGKNLFKQLTRELSEEEIEEEGIDMEEVVSNYSLLGIVSGDNPQAIIQDGQMNKTVFLSVGDNLGSITLTEILESEGRVTLSYKGREFDLGM